MILLENIQKSFQNHPVLQGIFLEIPSNAITVILGKSGQGKSVLLKILMGLVQPDEGKILLDGVNLLEIDSEERNEYTKKFGMLFQNAALFDSMSAIENVAFPLREHRRHLKEKEIHEIAQYMLKQVGLPNLGKKMPAELSGGMRKRVGLARALVLEPEIILYDEPTTGLDPLLTDSVDNLILETQRRLQITSIVVSHNIEGAFKIADKMAMLHEGKILEEGTPEAFRQSKKPFVQQFLLGKAGENFIG